MVRFVEHLGEMVVVPDVNVPAGVVLPWVEFDSDKKSVLDRSFRPNQTRS